MTAPAPSPQQTGATFPAVFDGIGALFVGADNDPDAQAARIPGLTWVAVKVNDKDASPVAERLHWVTRMRARGLKVGYWVYGYGPPLRDRDYIAVAQAETGHADLAIYDLEKEYKTDEGAPADWPGQLVQGHRLAFGASVPAAVTSYGAIPGYGNSPSSIDFGAFARAGWPIIAQAYDSFTVPDARTYTQTSGQPIPGPYPAAGVHTMVRSLQLVKSQAVYRPEGIDG